MRRTCLSTATIATLLLAAFILRIWCFVGLAQGDDIAYAELAVWASQGDIERSYSWFHLRWPVFLPTALLYALFGIRDATTHAVPLSLSLLNIALLAYLVRVEAGSKTAVVAAALYATTPLVVLESGFLEPGTFIETFLLSSLALLSSDRGTTSRWYLNGLTAGAGFSFGLAVMSRPSSAILAPVIAAYGYYRGMFRASAGISIRRLVLFGLCGTAPFVVQLALYYWRYDRSPLATFQMISTLLAGQYSAEHGAKPFDYSNLWFFGSALFRSDPPYDYRLFGYLGYVLIPAGLLAATFGARRPGGPLVVWFIAVFTLETFAPGRLWPYAPLVRNLHYSIVLLSPLAATIAYLFSVNLESPYRLLRTGTAMAIAGLLIANTVFSYRFCAHYRDYTAQHRGLIEGAILQSGRSSLPIFSFDGGQERYLRFYSTGTKARIAPIHTLEQIDSEGFLLLQGHAYSEHVRLPPAFIDGLIETPPERWEVLDRFGNFVLFHVQPIQPRPTRSDSVDFSMDQVTSPEVGNVIHQDMTGFGAAWIGDDQIFVSSTKPAEFELAFLLEKPIDSSKSNALRLTLAPDFSRIQIEVNSTWRSNPLNLKLPLVTVRCLELPAAALKQGLNKVVIRFLPNQSTEANYRAGLDGLAFGREKRSEPLCQGSCDTLVPCS